MAYTGAFDYPEAVFGDLFELSIEDAAQTLWDGLWDHEQATVEQIQQALEEAILNKELVPVRGTIKPIGSYNSNPVVLKGFDISEWAESRGLELESNGAFDSYVGDEASLADQLRDHLQYLRDRKAVGEEESAALEERLGAFTEEERHEAYLRLLHENSALRKQLEEVRPLSPGQDKIHGNAERFARNRESVLGVAVAVLAAYPDQCRNSRGKVEATKVRELIEQHALKYWPNTGYPPLATTEIEKLLRKYLGKTGE